MRIANMHKAGNAAMGKNSCQSKGLRLKPALTLSTGLILFADKACAVLRVIADFRA